MCVKVMCAVLGRAFHFGWTCWLNLTSRHRIAGSTFPDVLDKLSILTVDPKEHKASPGDLNDHPSLPKAQISTLVSALGDQVVHPKIECSGARGQLEGMIKSAKPLSWWARGPKACVGGFCCNGRLTTFSISYTHKAESV